MFTFSRRIYAHMQIHIVVYTHVVSLDNNVKSLTA